MVPNELLCKKHLKLLERDCHIMHGKLSAVANRSEKADALRAEILECLNQGYLLNLKNVPTIHEHVVRELKRRSNAIHPYRHLTPFPDQATWDTLCTSIHIVMLNMPPDIGPYINQDRADLFCECRDCADRIQLANIPKLKP